MQFDSLVQKISLLEKVVEDQRTLNEQLQHSLNNNPPLTEQNKWGKILKAVRRLIRIGSKIKMKDKQKAKQWSRSFPLERHVISKSWCLRQTVPGYPVYKSLHFKEHFGAKLRWPLPHCCLDLKTKPRVEPRFTCKIFKRTKVQVSQKG